MVAVPLPFRDPAVAFAPLAEQPFAMLLGGDGATAQSRFAVIVADPIDTVTLTPGAQHDPFAELRRRLARHRPAAAEAAPGPFRGGAVGFLGYEVGGLLERLPRRKAPVFPFDAAFGIYHTLAVFDLAARAAWIIAPDATRAKRFADCLGDASDVLPPPWDAGWTAELSAGVYEAKVKAVIEAIRAGDIYQANLTQRWTAPVPSGFKAFDLYRRLAAHSPAPFAALLSFSPTAQIISASPERFLQVDGTGRVETRPIKGTRARGDTPAADAALAQALLASAKDHAENLMIVDLLRNDISRVCIPGSVHVPTLCGLETFARVHHLVSVVAGQLAPGRDSIDLMAASFPGGSITGAPKIHAMEIIHGLEPVARGPYCGSIAWFGWDGAMDSSIVIRTLVRAGDRLMAQAGGGIVAESDPASEYAESVLKAQPLLAALNGHGRFACASA